MSESKSLIKKEIKQIDENYEKSTENNSVVLFAIEFDKEGFPFSQAVKCLGNPAALLAAFDMMENLIKKNRADVYEKLEKSQEISDRLADTLSDMSSLGSSPSAEDIEKLIRSNPEQIRDLLKDLKNRFGIK